MVEEGINYRFMEFYLGDTCTFKCGYCTLAESGASTKSEHLKFYKNITNINKIANFFDTYSDSSNKWNICFTGGEPFMYPNMDILSNKLINSSNKINFYTNLSIPLSHKNYSWINEDTCKFVDYIMCSFHPQWISMEDIFFERVAQLKNMGVKPIVRFVGHPKLLYLIDHLENKCGEIGVTFYPTTFFSNNYPQGYTTDERTILIKSMKGISPLIQLEGGLDVTGLKCKAGSGLFAVNIPRGGDITPCISTELPIYGNILRNEFQPITSPIFCPRNEKICTCDIHFQQGIIENADDTDQFELIKDGKGVSLVNEWNQIKLTNSIKTTDKYFAGQGGVNDDSILIFDKVKKETIKNKIINLKTNLINNHIKK